MSDIMAGGWLGERSFSAWPRFGVSSPLTFLLMVTLVFGMVPFGLHRKPGRLGRWLRRLRADAMTEEESYCKD